MAARQLIFARPGLKAGGGERIAQTAGRLSDLAAPQAAGGSPGVLAGDGASLFQSSVTIWVTMREGSRS